MFTPPPPPNQIPRCPRNMPNSHTLNHNDPLKGCKQYHNEIGVNFLQEVFKEYSDCVPLSKPSHKLAQEPV